MLSSLPETHGLSQTSPSKATSRAKSVRGIVCNSKLTALWQDDREDGDSPSRLRKTLVCRNALGRMFSCRIACSNLA